MGGGLCWKGSLMFTAQQYREKAAEYLELVKTAVGPNEVREYQSLARHFTERANDMGWLSVHASRQVEEARLTSMAIAIGLTNSLSREPWQSERFWANSTQDN